MRFVLKGDFHFHVFPTDVNGNSVILPVNINSEESYDLYFPIEKFRILVKQNYKESKKLATFIIDSVGDRYYYRTEKKIKDLIE